MTPTFLDSVLRGAEALAARDAVGTLPDPDLVRRFAADRDPAAFAVLVRRHGPLVWGVCRNLLPADADAEDAFQATFLALVRSAGAVRRSEALGAWLHGVAYRVAMKARRAAARRRRREQAVAVPEPDRPVSDAAWDELQAAVHEEVCRLPDKLRLPFVLCGLQGRQQKDAAKLLGWKVGTVSGRLTQARQRLLDCLARRGVPVGVAAGAAVLGLASGGAAVPGSVCLKVLAAAKDPAAASPVVLSLARGVTSMSLTRTKLLAAALLVAGALTTGIGSRVLSTADAQGPPAAKQDAQAEQVKKALEYLAEVTRARDRWEYKFVPVEKPLTAADLQKLLSTADREGWEYCGSQPLLADAKKGEAVPHMVFKRPRGGQAAAEYKAALDLYYSHLAEQQEREKAAKARAQSAAQKAREDDYARAVRAVQEAADKARDEAREQLRGQDQAKRLYADQVEAAKRAADQERVRAADLEKMIQKMRMDQQTIVDRLKELEAEKAARKARHDLPAVPARVSVPLKHVKAHDALRVLQKMAPADVSLEAHDRDNSLVVAGLSDAVGQILDAIAKTVDVPVAGNGGPDQPVTVRVRLANADGNAVVDGLSKAFPNAKIVREVHPDGIVLTGPANVVKEAADWIQKTAGAQPADPAADKPETVVLKPRHASPRDLWEVLSKVYEGRAKVTTDPGSNSLIIAGPPDVLAEAKKLVDALDAASAGVRP